MRFKEKPNGKVVIVESTMAAGMGNRVIGTTFVTYKYEDNPRDYPFVMEHREFYEKHFKIE